jgi:hypothetical protein
MALKVPGFLLRRLYVKGSLRATSDGFVLDFMNTLGSGYARRLLPVAVNGVEVDLSDCYFVVDGVEHAFADVTPETPFSLALNRTSTLGVRGVTLPDGAVTLRLGFEVQGLGDLSFEITDEAG